VLRVSLGRVCPGGPLNVNATIVRKPRRTRKGLDLELCPSEKVEQVQELGVDDMN
jgi:hypothetical protein